jgi:N-acetylglucosamine-6-phosphate deacetylase
VRLGVDGRCRGIAAPGFVDRHIHGFAGVDFASAEAVSYRLADELAPGAAADVVVLDDNLELRRVLVGGAERVAA